MNSYQRTKQYRDGRVVMSKNDWKKLRAFVWWAHEWIYGRVQCWMCGRTLYEFFDMQLDHWKEPRGMGGSTRDDRFVRPSCWKCNYEKGSQRNS